MSHFKEKYQILNQELLPNARSLLPDWLPGGKFEGQVYVCRNINGGLNEEGSGSFKIDLSDKGVWKDFGTNDKGGGDLVSLYARIKGLTQGKAYFELSGEMPRYYKPKLIKVRQEKIEPDEPIDLDIVQPPPNVLPQTMKHPSFGVPSAVYAYKNLKGELLFYVARYDISEDVKEIRAWSYSRSQKQFKLKWMNKPLPLYGLELLPGNDDKTIVLVEGEKSCEAARCLFDQDKFICMTWPRGASNVNCADFSPLFGREVIIWPDNDDAGLNACNQICEILWPHSESVTITVLPVRNWINQKGEPMPNAWDAADALVEGFSQQEVMNFINECGEIYMKNEVPEKSNVIPISKNYEDLTDQQRESLNSLAESGLKVSKKSGAPTSQMSNLLLVLKTAAELKDKIWYDEFYGATISTWNKEKPVFWQDHENNLLIEHLQKTYGFGNINKHVINDAIETVAIQKTRSEPREWMQNLKWDGIKRVEHFFVTHCNADDTIYSNALSKNWWVSLIARVYRPGCQCDNMLVLEGIQGAFKTSLLREIGGSWYRSLNVAVDSKDFLISLRGALIIEIGELNSFGKSGITAIKNIITTKEDSYRENYKLRNSQFLRQCIFVGTTNEDTYLKDSTGARRFWPLKVNGKIDIDKVRRDREQLFAEAVSMFESGATWWEMPEKETEEEQEKRREVSVIEDYLDQYLEEYNNLLSDGITMKSVHSWFSSLGLLYPHQLTAQALGAALRKKGFEKIQKKSSNKNIKVWVRVKND